MPPIKIIKSKVVTEGGKIRLSFDILNRQLTEFQNCCLKVTLGDQVSRHDLPTLKTKIEGISVEFIKPIAITPELKTTCQLFHGDRIIGATDYTL